MRIDRGYHYLLRKLMRVDYAALIGDLRGRHSVIKLLDAKPPAFPANAAWLPAS